VALTEVPKIDGKVTEGLVSNLRKSEGVKTHF
jgi:hypothetical protein